MARRSCHDAPRMPNVSTGKRTIFVDEDLGTLHMGLERRFLGWNGGGEVENGVHGSVMRYRGGVREGVVGGIAAGSLRGAKDSGWMVLVEGLSTSQVSFIHERSIRHGAGPGNTKCKVTCLQ